MKQIIKYISVIMLLLCSTEAFALRGGYGVDKGTVAGGDIAFYSEAFARLRGSDIAKGTIVGGDIAFYLEESCQTQIYNSAPNETVYIKATANYSKRLGTADAQGKVSFIKVEQTVSSGVAMTRGDVLGLSPLAGLDVGVVEGGVGRGEGRPHRA